MLLFIDLPSFRDWMNLRAMIMQEIVFCMSSVLWAPSKPPVFSSFPTTNIAWQVLRITIHELSKTSAVAEDPISRRRMGKDGAVSPIC